MRALARMRCRVDWMLSGSTVSGEAPSRPASTARSVPWPIPVSASEPYRRTATSAVCPSSPSRLSPSTNSRAARIGPMVWELDGPMPTLKMSNTLSVMSQPRAPALAGARLSQAVCGLAARPTCFAATQRGLKCDPAAVAGGAAGACPDAQRGAA